MARAISTDFYQNFRFHVMMVEGDGVKASEVFTKAPTAGFNSVTIPELSMEATEYREGTAIYTKKFAGIPSYDSVTMTKGVTQDDNDFWLWANKAAAGGEYRADLKIMHFNREDVQGFTDVGMAAHTGAYRAYMCYNCVPTRLKLTADMDATGSDVSIAELEVAVEQVVLMINGETV
jgi:phage tail-like protein